jgi:hypothetical protein
VGLLRYLGFAIPFAVALDRKTDPTRDATPTPGRCSFCKRQKEDTFRLTSEERVCADDIASVVHRSGARRILSQPRSVGEWPLEKVAERPQDQVPLDPWWDRQLS